MGWLDFENKTVLVVGGSSGIGNGIAHGFADQGADVHVWGTRASAADYDGEEGSDLCGLSYTRVDVSNDTEVAETPVDFDTLDVLVLSQGRCSTIVRNSRSRGSARSLTSISTASWPVAPGSTRC